ncbi:hypothetical protein GCM10010116_41990 [Microbispora rosea subsp. aerata]|nr:hypothetical protein GCM10010116_41990 [Microbispora rosea subsp. aerata]GIH56096.1 hypothetical protein Mro02_30100 [Microbispora rosea subsp. aerata]GLJ85661.1 hypothetical protein GCM10017588_43940 [Microbispora rosea subsp. aerata]
MKKVAKPPRISWPMVDPRAEMEKYRSRKLGVFMGFALTRAESQALTIHGKSRGSSVVLS